MAVQQYSTVAARNLIRAEMEMLRYAETIQVLGKFGEQKTQPLNKSDTVVFRRVQPFGAGSNGVPVITAANFVTAEGVTPTANTISYVNPTATLQQYAVLFKFTSKAALMYEDDIPGDMQKLTGETLAEVAELVCYGQVRGGTNVLYSNGSTRTAVNTALTLNSLRLAKRTLETNRARVVTKAIAAGPNFGTAPVEPSYPVFCHTDAVADIRNLPGFTKRVEYGSAITPIHEREIGECEGFRFIPSPLFAPFLAGGSGTLNGMLSVGAAAVDVYPTIIMADDAWGHISLKGHNYTGISPTLIPASTKNHANPSGMFGFVGADFWYAPIRLNENWMIRIEHGCSSLA